jgi:hypothetical protein
MIVKDSSFADVYIQNIVWMDIPPRKNVRIVDIKENALTESQ